MKNIKYLLVVPFLVGLLLPSIASAATIEELEAQINVLMAQFQSLQSQLAQAQGQPPAWCYDFNTNLKIEMRGAQVETLQIALTKEGFDAGSSGKNEGYFDDAVASAVSGFQQKYKDEILTPLGLKYGTGFVGKATRAKLNSLYGCEIKPVPLPPIITPITPITPITACENYTYGTCPSDCEKVCIPTYTSGNVSTGDCDGKNSCRTKSINQPRLFPVSAALPLLKSMKPALGQSKPAILKMVCWHIQLIGKMYQEERLV